MEIGLDIGYGWTKKVDGVATIFPSQVGETPQMHDTGVETTMQWHLLEPFDMLVGQAAVDQGVGSPQMFTDWFLTKSYKALFLAALATTTDATHASLTVVSGLPLNYHYQYRDILTKQLLGEHRVRIAGNGRRAQTLNVETVKVIPQGVGVLFAQWLDSSGKICVEGDVRNRHVAVLDIGSNNTNLLGMRGFQEISSETGSMDLGAWNIERLVRLALAGPYPGLMDRMGEHALMQAIIARQMRYRGQPVDISNVVEPALAQVGSDILQKASQLWAGADDIDCIYLGGGGALLFGDMVKQAYPQAIVVKDPVWANAQGYYNLARRLAKAQPANAQ